MINIWQKIKNFLVLEKQREIYKIHISNAVRSVSLSFISIYIPVYLLDLGYSLSQTILFFVVYHAFGLVFVFVFLVPLMRNYGLVRTLKLHYPLLIISLVLLILLKDFSVLFWFVAVIGGVANFVYWVPLNILLIKHVDGKRIGSDLSIFFAMPKFFKILGPLFGALLLYVVGFWFVFVLSIIGLIASYFVIFNIGDGNILVKVNCKNIFGKIKNRKLLFFLEIFDNVLEESEWFWIIFVYILLDSISAPGVVGGVVAVGGALFTLIAGKYSNKHSYAITFMASFGIIVTWGLRFFLKSPLFVYLVSIAASFIMTAFLVSYFSVIYKDVKNNKEEEFLIIREIPTVLGRMIVFGVILFNVNNPRNLFFLPIFASFILIVALIVKNRQKIS